LPVWGVEAADHPPHVPPAKNRGENIVDLQEETAQKLQLTVELAMDEWHPKRKWSDEAQDKPQQVPTKYCIRRLGMIVVLEDTLSVQSNVSSIVNVEGGATRLAILVVTHEGVTALLF